MRSGRADRRDQRRLDEPLEIHGQVVALVAQFARRLPKMAPGLSRRSRTTRSTKGLPSSSGAHCGSTTQVSSRTGKTVLERSYGGKGVDDVTHGAQTHHQIAGRYAPVCRRCTCSINRRIRSSSAVSQPYNGIRLDGGQQRFERGSVLRGYHVVYHGKPGGQLGAGAGGQHGVGGRNEQGQEQALPGGAPGFGELADVRCLEDVEVSRDGQQPPAARAPLPGGRRPPSRRP